MDLKYNSGIYCLISPSKKMYIGQSINLSNRFRKYRYFIHYIKEQPKIYNALVKYGFENFTIKILAYAKDKNNLNKLEEYFIKKYDTVKTGYNITYGGGQCSFSPETKEKISLKVSGKNHPMYGKHHSEETKNKIKNSQIGNKSFWYGKKRTNENCEKISGKNSGKFKGSVIATNITTNEVIILNGTKDIIKFGFSPSHVASCLTKKRKSHKNYTFNRI